MALITNFEVLELEKPNVHEPVEASLGAFTAGEETFIQINTYGRSGRKLTGKTSQTIQLDREAAKKLVEVIKAQFQL